MKYFLGVCFLSFFSLVSVFNLSAQQAAGDSGTGLIRVEYVDDGYSGWDTDSLETAIARNDSLMVSKLLAKGYKIDNDYAYYFKPLIKAAQLNRITIVKMLLDNGYNVNDTTSFDKTSALHEAIRNEFGPLADLLLYAGANPDMKDYKGSTPLMYTAGYGQEELTDMLLFYGASTDPVDKDSNNALMIAVYASSVGVAELLLNAGADPNSPDKYGFTPLMVASSFGDTIMVELLLEAGADPNKSNSSGCDALCVALRNKQYGIVPLLLKGGSNVNTTIGLAQKPRDLVPRNSSLDSLFRVAGAHRSPLPQFTSMSIGYTGLINQRDWLHGFSLGLIDQRYKLRLNLSFYSRFWYSSVLEKDTGNVFWQMHEMRFLAMADLGRDFIIFKTGKKSYGLYLNSGLGFTWGSYRGAEQGPLGRYVFTPGAGLVIQKNNWNVRAGYSYLDFKIPEFSKNRFSINYTYRFSLLPRKSYIKKL
ncbi:MAG: ankyrin repeat domain-containing protein [Bacteroidales bacterium]